MSQSFYSRISPGDPRIGVGPYRIRAPNVSWQDHGKKRIVVSYIYLLILRQLRQQGIIRANALLETVESTLQARRGSQGNQGAHQLLRELRVGNTLIYHLPNIGPYVTATLVYCSAAVSDIPTAYNDADGLIEISIRPEFLRLAMACVSDAPPGNGEIFRTLCDNFVTACQRAKLRSQDGNVDGILDGHIGDAKQLRSRADAYSRHDLNHWLDLINREAISLVNP